MAPNGAAPPGAEPTAVTRAFVASTGMGLFGDRTRLQPILQRTLALSPGLLAGDHKVPAPVLLPARFILVAAERRFLALADHRDAL